MKIPIDVLKGTTLQVLRYSGYPQEEAEVILDVLMYAQLRGNNQGIVKLIGAGMPRDTTADLINIVRETELSVLLDGARNSGMVVMTHALDLALEKARQRGFGIVGTRNTNSSTGAIGYYASRAANAGYIGLMFSGSGEYVAMHGSYEPILGTNPLAFGIPTADTPIVFDMATSAIARYGIVEAQTAGRSIADDVAYDRNGNQTNDASAALAGAIRTFGGYKGAALSFLVEVLTHVLVGTVSDENGHKTDWGNLVIVIDPALLSDKNMFIERIGKLVKRLKNAKRLPGVDAILVPGERGNQIYEAIMKAGVVEVEDRLWTALQKAANHG